MRVMVTINGRQQVDQVYEVEMVNDKELILHTSADLMDIRVTGVNDMEHYSINHQLLEKGYVDLSRCHAEYIEDDDDEDG